MSNQKIFPVEGMSCGHCEMAVVKSVKTIPGVKDATASANNKNVVITYEGELHTEDVKKKVAEAGYTLSM